MRYHYKIVSVFDANDVPFDSSRDKTRTEGFESSIIAERYGVSIMELKKLNKFSYRVETMPFAHFPSAEIIAEAIIEPE